MKKNILAFMIAAVLCFLVTPAHARGNIELDQGGKISIAAMNGPTMMGLGQLYNAISGDLDSDYTITKEATADAVIAGLANKTYAAACLPANNAAIIFNNGNIGVKVAAINTLNVLYVMHKAGKSAVTSLGDLAGKTVYLPGQGSTPEFVLRYLLAKNNVANVKIEFETEGSTIAAGIKTANSKYDYAVLPQPAATVAASGAGAAIEAMNLTNEWKKQLPNSDIVTGVLVVRIDFLKNNRDTFEKFLDDYKKSVNYMTNPENLDTAAAYIADMGIIPSTAVAKRALPKCGITYTDKAEMKNMLNGFYGILYEQNPASIGGRIPADIFYYQ